MPTGFFRWSRTANSNASATYDWSEGMAPSTVNDSARGIMSDAARWRDDISGAIATSGTSTAYTVTSYSTFDSLANMSGQLIAFTPHTTNGATVTLNVDGLGAKPLRSAPSVELLAGTLIQGTPYVAVYNNSDAAFYLHGLYGNPYNVPLAAGMDYWASTTPNSAFAFPAGQAISRTTYSTLFALIGTTYGAGDGTTFNLPDKRGRFSASLDNMGGSAASRLTDAVSGIGDVLGEAGGSQSKTLVTANLPAYTPSGSISNGAISISHNAAANSGGSSTGGGQFPINASSGASISASQAASSFSGAAQGGTSTAFSIIPPTICCNYILRII
ncbi:tail fiber protein [Bradyrhizobium sp. RDT10]